MSYQRRGAPWYCSGVGIAVKLRTNFVAFCIVALLNEQRKKITDPLAHSGRPRSGYNSNTRCERHKVGKMIPSLSLSYLQKIVQNFRQYTCGLFIQQYRHENPRQAVQYKQRAENRSDRRGVGWQIGTLQQVRDG